MANKYRKAFDQFAASTPGKVLSKAGKITGGSIADFAGKSGEMTGAGIKGLRTKTVQPLSFTPKQYIKTGIKAGAQAYGIANAGRVLVAPAKQAAASAVEKGFKTSASEMKASNLISGSKRAIANSNLASKTTNVIKPAEEIVKGTVRKYLNSRFNW